MNETITIGWEWILGTLITLILTVLGGIIKWVYNLKKDLEQRVRFLENQNSAKTSQIDTLNEIVLRPFEKKEKKK